jgi:O-antigen/teichoic acid export membrane protein
MDLGVAGFLLSLLIGNLGATAVLLARLPVLAALRAGAFDRALLRRMLAFSTPLVPNVMLWWLTNISGRYFLAFTQGVEQVGVFGVAARFPALVTMVTTVFAQAWQLSANRSAADDDRSTFYSDVFRYYAAALILSVASLVIVLKPLMRVIAAPAFFEAWEAVPPLLAGSVFAAFASFYGAIYTAAHRSSGVFRTTLVAGVASLVFNSLLVPTIGVVGAALSIALCFLGLWLLRVVDSQTITPTKLSARLLMPAFFLLTLQAAVQYIPIEDALRYPLMCGAWLSLVWLFRREIGEGVTRLLHVASRTRG